jgi:hypothetical protein
MQLELAIDFDGDTARKRDMSHGRARVLSEIRTPKLEEKIRCAVNYLWLVGKLRRAVGCALAGKNCSSFA